MAILYGADLLADVAKFLIAWFFNFAVVGGLRRPDDWLSFAGWALGSCWVAIEVGVRVARVF